MPIRNWKIMRINHMRNDFSQISHSLETLYLLFKEIYCEDYVNELQEMELMKMDRVMLDAILSTLANLIEYDDMFNEFIKKYQYEIKGCESFTLYDEEHGLFKMQFNPELLKDRLKNMYSYFNELNTHMALTEAKYCICAIS